MANLILDKQGRLGKPIKINGLSQNSRSPEFTSTMGLIAYGQNEYRRGELAQTKVKEVSPVFWQN